MHRPAKQPRQFGYYLSDEESHLATLCRHVEFLTGLEKKLQEQLSDPLRSHCKVANISNKTLVLHADSAVWATRLRYCTPEILRFMQTECNLTTLKTIRIKVKPAAHQHSHKVQEKPLLSAETSDLIRHAANSLTDMDLRNSLHNIARHYRDI